MMKKGLVLFTTLFLIFNMSCSSIISKKFNSDECTEYYLFILTHWRHTSYRYYYLTGQKDVNRIQDHLKKDCLIGLQPQNIFRIFGKPTKEIVLNFPHIRHFEYFVIKDNHETSAAERSSSLIFEFDESDKVVDVHITPAKGDN